MAVGKRNLEGRIARNHAESVVGKMQVADHLRAEHAGDVRSRGCAATGSDLFRDTASAHNVAAFENQCGISGAREIRGGGEAVVASADDDSVVKRVGTARHAIDRWSKRGKTPVEEINESP